MEEASAFRDALKGLKSMHDRSWLHSDLKPNNIGVTGKSPLGAVLLDVGSSARVQPGTAGIKATPGSGGTIGYMSPERELEEYDQGEDIWAMGVILYMLTHGHHPWKFSINPWRDEPENEKLRGGFRDCYDATLKEMTSQYETARRSPTEGYIHRTSPCCVASCGWLQNKD